MRVWHGLHPQLMARGRWGKSGPLPIIRGSAIRVEVEHLPKRSTGVKKTLWLWWSGPGEPDLDLCWRAYMRRFDIEHTFRFVKNTLGGNAGAANTRAGRTLDVARRSGLYPTSSRSRPRRRHATALGETSSSFATEPGEGSQGISSTACTDRYSSASTEIPQARSRTSQGHSETTQRSLSSGQESSVMWREGFNRKLK